MAGFFRDPPPVVVPDHWTKADLGEVPMETMVEMVEWILSSDVLERGVIHRSNKAVNDGQGLLGALGAEAQRMLWEMARSTLVDLANSNCGLALKRLGGSMDAVRYRADFFFADARDAIEFKLRFG